MSDRSPIPNVTQERCLYCEGMMTFVHEEVGFIHDDGEDTCDPSPIRKLLKATEHAPIMTEEEINEACETYHDALRDAPFKESIQDLKDLTLEEWQHYRALEAYYNRVVSPTFDGEVEE